MTKLNYTVALDDYCNLTVTDTSGYYDSVNNPNGFLPETNTDTPAFGLYKLSQGYFLNVLLYNKYNVAPIITNSTEEFYHVPSSVSSTYANNFTPTIYALSADGTFTLKRIFIISDTYYASVVNSGIFAGHDIYYTDGTVISFVTSGVPAPVSISVFLNANTSNATVMELDTAFISTCKLNACYYKLMNIILDSKMFNCDDPALAKLVQSKDLIYMTLESIKYMQESNSITQIQKLIEAVDSCCSICSTKLVTQGSSSRGTTGGCGCG